MSGTFVIDVLEAKDLNKGQRDATNPFVKVRVGSQEKQTKPINDTLTPQWNEKFEFTTDSPSVPLHVQVWDFQNGLNDLMGEFKVEVGRARHAEADRWVLLQPKPSGELKLVWKLSWVENTPMPTSPTSPSTGKGHKKKSHAADKAAHATPAAPAEEDDGSLGQLTLEVVNGKKLELAEFADQCSCWTSFEWAGEEKTTRVKKKSRDPYWNEAYNFTIMEADHTAVFKVFDEDEANRLIGSSVHQWTFGTQNQKGSEWLKLEREGATDELGSIFIRYTYKAKKRKVKESDKKLVDEDDIDLGYVPKITGQTGVLPDKRLYIWFSLFEDNDWRSAFYSKLLGSYTRREKQNAKPGIGQSQWVEVPYGSIDEIVEEAWTCKTRQQLFIKVRSAAQAFKVTGSVMVGQEEEERNKYRWKESSIMMQEIENSFKVEKAINNLWNVFAYEKPDPTPEQRRNVDARVGKKMYTTLTLILFGFICPDMSKKVARKIATEEWNRRDSKHADHVDDSFLFKKFVKDLAAFWCDTLTEWEYHSFLSTLMKLVVKARKEGGKRTRSPGKKGKGKKGKKAAGEQSDAEGAAPADSERLPSAGGTKRSSVVAGE
eukprot:NODE_312_length_2098_cov_42.013699_g306_i0.p1 GENE.NODE_312_length_2098_cov_42.013699_g306_i0~~NODE_312_length_2098_cov_42.013699_g306_i0.p1  ORF type:complete len:601 (-),score=187.41 NODE_312_length_2098_cov_42.013699_g306_i0:35-1837(-)